jgi:hypothetical protein
MIKRLADYAFALACIVLLGMTASGLVTQGCPSDAVWSIGPLDP